MLKLKLQYFDHQMSTGDLLEKTLKLRQIEGKRRREKKKIKWINSITDSEHEFKPTLETVGFLCGSAGKKNPPEMQETCVQSLDWEDPLEKGKATHPSILSWGIPWAVESMGSQSDRTE